MTNHRSSSKRRETEKKKAKGRPIEVLQNGRLKTPRREKEKKEENIAKEGREEKENISMSLNVILN